MVAQVKYSFTTGAHTIYFPLAVSIGLKEDLPAVRPEGWRLIGAFWLIGQVPLCDPLPGHIVDLPVAIAIALEGDSIARLRPGWSHVIGLRILSQVAL